MEEICFEVLYVFQDYVIKESFYTTAIASKNLKEIPL